VLRDVLEHVDDGLGFYREACRVLRPGGYLLLSSPDNQSHVWNEPTHRRPYPLSAQEYLAATARMTIVYRGYESVAPGTQRIARVAGGRTPWPVRLGWRLPFWPRNAVTVQKKPG
jgi:2-polyprenyl-3-methyl-5-hydroxy-6-metoxy-1,4-benzoquinol methylase